MRARISRRSGGGAWPGASCVDVLAGADLDDAVAAGDEPVPLDRGQAGDGLGRLGDLLIDPPASGRCPRPAAVFDGDLPVVPAHVAADMVANRLDTSICVRCGRKPAPVRTRRVSVSCGDSAPASARPMASRSWTMPRGPLWRSIKTSMSTVLTSVACIRASRRMTANVNPYRRPRSNAVRAAVVTGMPRTKDISSSNSSSLCKTMPSVLSHDRRLIADVPLLTRGVRKTVDDVA
jgi:hypothetical protein